MIRQSLLESWRRNFCEKQLKNGAWDLGGVPHLAPEGGLVLPRQTRVSLVVLIVLPRPTMGSGGFSKNKTN
jgi:hypothetical protein